MTLATGTGWLRTAAVLAALSSGAIAQAEGPPTPAGVDPGGIAVALIGGGVDYRLPAIAARLARDGEGEIIGRDVTANDARPFRAAGSAGNIENDGVDSTAITAAIRSSAPVRVVAVRAVAGDLPSLVRAIAFAAQTPARVIVLPLVALNGPSGEMVRQASLRYPAKLFVIGLAEEPDGALPQASSTGAVPTLKLGNLLLVSVAVDAKAEPHLAELLVEIGQPGASPAERLATAVAETVSALACVQAATPAAPAAALKAALFASADPLKATGGRKVLVSPCR